ncbi:hypothetical protein ETD83_41905 [Actinomadura soli]|uniref:Uncharacterized protein n=1 Tax=Actinomadura soli TaxID=2508997 RepID=A0A5C4IXV0_9ACTN|nr:hypothetical protein [Actinomadura soli]TMQ79860.1 hypothetical protein ETD83_41905 [Actinomadura soli]
MLPSSLPTFVTAVVVTPSPTPTTPPTEHGGDGGGLWLLLLLAAFIWAVAHVISVHLHPLRTCRACRGTGLHHGHLFTGAMRVCRRCGGTRRELHPGARATARHRDH